MDVRDVELAVRVAAVERRLDAIESGGPSSTAPAHAPDPPLRDTTTGAADPEQLWVLDGLRSRVGEHSAVLFGGAVTLPDHRPYQWQQGADTDTLLEADWDTAAEPLAALGHPVRLAVLRGVLTGLHTTAELAHHRRACSTRRTRHHRAALPPPAPAAGRRMAALDRTRPLRRPGHPSDPTSGDPHRRTTMNPTTLRRRTA